MLGETGEAKEGDMALLAVSDRDPGGDELIWSGATAPSTTEPRGGQFHGLKSGMKLHTTIRKTHTQVLCTNLGKEVAHIVGREAT